MEASTYNHYLEALVNDTPNALCWVLNDSDDFFRYVSGINLKVDLHEAYSYDQLIDALRTYMAWAKKNHRFSAYAERARYDIRFGVQTSLNWLIQGWKKEHPEVDDLYDKLEDDATKIITEEFEDLL